MKKNSIISALASVALAASMCTPAVAFADGQTSRLTLNYIPTPVEANAAPLEDTISFAVPSTIPIAFDQDGKLYNASVYEYEDGTTETHPSLVNNCSVDLVLDASDILIDPDTNFTINGVAPAAASMGTMDIKFGFSATDEDAETLYSPHGGEAHPDAMMGGDDTPHAYIDFLAGSRMYLSFAGTFAPNLIAADGTPLTIEQWAESYAANSNAGMITWTVYPMSKVKTA